MASLGHQHLTLPNVLCCICGVPIQNNPTNMCVACLHDRVDITQDINKKLVVQSCRNCGR
jgi:nonsense-mediated mRNA decay protein 3